MVKGCMDELGRLKYLRIFNELREIVEISHEELEALYYNARSEFEQNPGIFAPSKCSDDDFLPVDEKWEELDSHMMAILIVRYNLVFFFPAFVKMLEKVGKIAKGNSRLQQGT